MRQPKYAIEGERQQRRPADDGKPLRDRFQHKLRAHAPAELVQPQAQRLTQGRKLREIEINDGDHVWHRFTPGALSFSQPIPRTAPPASSRKSAARPRSPGVLLAFAPPAGS